MTGADGDRRVRRPGSGLFAANMWVGLGTGLSRLTGLLRVLVIGVELGQAQLTDTYNFANNTPNVVYELLLGGMLTASLLPMFVQHRDDGDDDATSAVISVAVIALAVLTVIAVAAAPALVHLYTLRVHDNVATVRSVGTRLARLFLPQIFFYGLIALASALLNSRRKFRTPAMAPAVTNLLVIGVVLAIPHVVDGPLTLTTAATSSRLVLLLGLGTTAGIAVNALVLLPALRRVGIHLRWRPDFGHPAVRRMLRLSGWTFGYVVANQVAYLVVTMLALGGAGGDQSAYVNAFTFFQLPHGLLAVSLMTTFSTDLASAHHRGDTASFRRQMHLGLRALGLVVIPASLGYMVLARPIMNLVLQHGHFTAANAALTARVLVAFAVGLFGFSAYLFVLRGFYNMGDARTPFIVNVGENAVNVILGVAFMHRWGVVGLAWSYALAYLAAAALAYVVLVAQLRGMHTLTLFTTIGRYLASAAVMALAVRALVHRMGNSAASAVVGAIAGAAIYLALVIVSGMAQQAWTRARRKSSPEEAEPVTPAGSPDHLDE